MSVTLIINTDKPLPKSLLGKKVGLEGDRSSYSHITHLDDFDLEYANLSGYVYGLDFSGWFPLSDSYNPYLLDGKTLFYDWFRKELSALLDDDYNIILAQADLHQPGEKYIAFAKAYVDEETLRKEYEETLRKEYEETLRKEYKESNHVEIVGELTLDKITNADIIQYQTGRKLVKN